MVFQPVPEPRTGKNRLHLDVEVDEIQVGIAQVRALGGSETGERHEYDEGVVVVVRDVEGNEFCLVQIYGQEQLEGDGVASLRGRL